MTGETPRTWDYVTVEMPENFAAALAQFDAWAQEFKNQRSRWWTLEGTTLRTVRHMYRGPVVAVEQSNGWRHPERDALLRWLWTWAEERGAARRAQLDQHHARKPDLTEPLLKSGDEFWAWQVGEHHVGATMTDGINLITRGTIEPDEADRLAGALAAAADYVRARREHRDTQTPTTT